MSGSLWFQLFGPFSLVQRFHEQIAGVPHSWIEAVAAPFFQNTPFYPVADMLKQTLAWRGNESAEEQLALLERSFVLAGLKPSEALPLIAPLLNLPLPANYPPSPLSPEQRRRRLLATLVELALGTARVQPMVIATEDLHWADPSTLELIQLLVEQGATARLLLLYTARPEFRAQWPLRAQSVLRERLLLSLHGLGTNTGLKRMTAGQPGTTYKDLLYVRRRFITREHLREAITRVVDAGGFLFYVPVDHHAAAAIADVPLGHQVLVPGGEFLGVRRASCRGLAPDLGMARAKRTRSSKPARRRKWPP